MKKDKARGIAQERMRWNLRDARSNRGEIEYDNYPISPAPKQMKSDGRRSLYLHPMRRERKPVSVKPKPMYGRWGW